MRIEDLEAYSEAWNAHDIDRIMAYMTGLDPQARQLIWQRLRARIRVPYLD